MNPKDRLKIITEIALHLQADYNTTGINVLLSGYGIETDNVSIVNSKRLYVIDLLKSQPNDIIIRIAKDLEMELTDIVDFADNDDKNNTSKKPKKVFISHSSIDSDIVEKVIDTLEAIGVPSEQIFCSSFEGYGIKLGSDFLETIKNELNSKVLVLFILSSNFYSSIVSLCEMGATWVKTNEHIPILIPPFNYENVKGVIPTTHGMKINEKAKFNSLKEKVESFMELKPINFSAWERKRDNILKEIKAILDNRKTKFNEKIKVKFKDKRENITGNKYDNVDTKIKELSKREWPDDFVMQLDFIQRQRDAVEKLQNHQPEDLSTQEFEKIRANAKKEWPDDFVMQLDYEQRQVASLRRLKDLE